MYFRAKVGRLTNVALVNSDDTSSSYVAEGHDPQVLLVREKTGRDLALWRGSYYLFVQMSASQGLLERPCAYVDYGAGFSQEADHCFEGKQLASDKWCISIDLKGSSKCIRFDPSSQQCAFVLKDLYVVSKGTLLARAAREAAWRYASSLIGFGGVGFSGVGAASNGLGKSGQPVPEHPSTGGRELARLSRLFDFASVERSEPFRSGYDRDYLSRFVREYQDRLYTCEDGRFYYNYAGLATDPIGPVTVSTRTIAFYLPQMHPIPENDRWWGRGFTEWTNVSKAVPQFVGHYQPRLPGELGYYDLRSPDTLKRQVELAQTYGLDAFCFYFYWFSGKRLLERPLDMFLNDPSLKLGFCICWANENWTRRWDGLESEVLIAQDHAATDVDAVFRDWLPYIRDDRYLKVDGRPCVLIYRPDLIPDIVPACERWRRLAKDHGLGGLYLLAGRSFGNAVASPEGFDGLYEFPPHNLRIPHIDPGLQWLDEEHGTHAFSYADAVAFATNANAETSHAKTADAKTADAKTADAKTADAKTADAKTADAKTADNGADIHPGVLVGWDTEARKPGRGDVFFNANPTLFRRWLESAYRRAERNPDEDKRLVFINAWNEWAEGAYLEPDRRHGYGFLTALRSVVRQFGLRPDAAIEACEAYNTTQAASQTTAIVVHLFYYDLLDQIEALVRDTIAYLAFDLILTMPETWDTRQVNAALARLKPTRAFVVPNVGRDVYPFLFACRSVADLGYRFLCKIHSKKSTHRVDGDTWRRDLYAGLLSKDALDYLGTRFFGSDARRIAAPEGSFMSLADPNLVAGNQEHFDNLRGAFDIARYDDSSFIAGTMFWFTWDALAPIFDCGLRAADFGDDLGQVDGTLAHAFERLFALFVEKTGGTVIRVPTRFEFDIARR